MHIHPVHHLRQVIYPSLTACICLLLMACPSEMTTLEKIAAYDIDIPEPSGLAIGPSGDYLYIVSDRKGKIYQTDIKGRVIGTIDVKARDYEGIAYDHQRDVFYVLDEKNNRALIIGRDGKTQHKLDFPWKAESNSGPEGIDISSDGHRLFVVNEKNPARIVICDTTGTILQDIPPPQVADLSAIAYDASNDELYVVSDEDHAILRLSMNGKVLAVYPIDIKKAEGIALDQSGRRLYIVSDEEEELHVYKY